MLGAGAHGSTATPYIHAVDEPCPARTYTDSSRAWAITTRPPGIESSHCNAASRLQPIARDCCAALSSSWRHRLPQRLWPPMCLGCACAGGSRRHGCPHRSRNGRARAVACRRTYRTTQHACTLLLARSCRVFVGVCVCVCGRRYALDRSAVHTSAYARAPTVHTETGTSAGPKK